MKMVFGISIAALCAGAMADAQETRMQMEPQWEYVADTVMGGVSAGQIADVTVEGRAAVQLTGQVSLDNNGGFVQMAFDMAPGAGAVDMSDYAGIEMQVFGNGEVYDLRLRTDALERPWQSFRTDFVAPAEWTTVRVPFTQFEAHRTDATFDPARLRRVGVLAIGREFQAEIAISDVRFYR